MKNKRASEKYYIIISLILGLIVLSLSLYYIFHEFFTQDELDWQECRQSIYLRHISPEFKAGSLKGVTPLKCKTEVVTIDTAEPNKVYGKISDTIAAGWHLFGEGEYDIVPRQLISENAYCMVFARIHFTEKSKEEFYEKYRNLSEQEFTSFYLRTKKANSDKTYNDYIPLFWSTKESSHSVFYFPSSFNFYPSEEDILLVYRVKKYNSVKNFFGVGFDITDFSYFNMDEENYKTLYLIHPEDLKKIGCDEFLTIPA